MGGMEQSIIVFIRDSSYNFKDFYYLGISNCFEITSNQWIDRSDKIIMDDILKIIKDSPVGEYRITAEKTGIHGESIIELYFKNTYYEYYILGG